MDEICLTWDEGKIIALSSEVFNVQPLCLHFIIQTHGRVDKVLTELGLTLDHVSVLLAPDLEEIIAEKFKLALQAGIVFPHGCDVLLQ